MRHVCGHAGTLPRAHRSQPRSIDETSDSSAAAAFVAAAAAVAVAAPDPYQTRFPASQSTHAAGGGDVYIRARCPWSADDGCGGDVRLAEAVGEFATGEAYTPREPFYLQPGQRGWLVVQLTRRAMRRLERRGRLEARIVVYPSHRHGPPNQGGEVDVLPPCPGASEFSSGC